jgi:hypothetical protein
LIAPVSIYNIFYAPFFQPKSRGSNPSLVPSVPDHRLKKKRWDDMKSVKDDTNASIKLLCFYVFFVCFFHNCCVVLVVVLSSLWNTLLCLSELGIIILVKAVYTCANNAVSVQCNMRQHFAACCSYCAAAVQLKQQFVMVNLGCYVIYNAMVGALFKFLICFNLMVDLQICFRFGMYILLKKDAGRSANHTTSNTLWVSGWPDLLHEHNINKTQCSFLNNAQIAVIFALFYLDRHVT